MTDRSRSYGTEKQEKGPGKSDMSGLPEVILSHIGVGIYIVQDGVFVYTSPLYQRMTGYSDPDLIGRNSLDLLHPDDRASVRDHATEVLKGKRSEPYEYRFIKSDGETMWILEMVTSVVYHGKRATLGSFMDITERRRIQEMLRQSEEKYRAIIDNIQDGYFELDLAGNYTFCNGALCEIHGYPKDELLGMNNRQYTDQTNAEKVFNAFRAIYRTGEPGRVFDYEIIRRDGTRRQVEVSASLKQDASGTPIGFSGIARDISERKQAEEAARRSDERTRSILDSIEDGYWEVNLEGQFTFFNDAMCRISHLSREELLGMNLSTGAAPEAAERLAEAFQEVSRTGVPLQLADYEITRGDGTRGTYEISASLMKDQAGGAIGFQGITRDITKRKTMEDQIRHSEERYRTIVEQMEDGYFETDLRGRMTFVNDAECRNIGFSREGLIGRDSRLFADKDTFQELSSVFAEVYRTGIPVRAHAFAVTQKGGSEAFHEISVSLIKDSEGKPTGFRGIARDVTERKVMEEQIRQSEERYRTIIEEMEEWYVEADLAGTILFCNDIFATGLGHAPGELARVNFRRFVRREVVEAIYRQCDNVYQTGEPSRNLPYEFTRPDGSTTSTEFSIFPRRNHEGKIVGFRGVGRDITERKRAEERIQYLATHDTLTGLPNRLMFAQHLNHAIQAARRHKRQLAVLFFDLDRFKVINDTLGHEAGDQLLRAIAVRLRERLRAVDVIARLGGDEFVILVEEVGDEEQVITVAQHVLAAIIKPIMIMEQECRITASIGISIYPQHGEDEQSLMKNADIAMYFAKEKGKNNYQLYSTDIKTQSIERLSIETNLRMALQRDEFSLHYQAKLDFKTGAITGVEALLRWDNPALGSVTPLQFIPVAEETGLIVPIGRWVLKTACAQNIDWQRQGLTPLCMAVNLSLRQLTDEGLLSDIQTTLGETGMAPHLLELEITESMVMHDPPRMVKILSEIKKMGVRLALDDFGTGYSSLAQIKQFPIDTLKVDRSFIRNIPNDSEENAITEAIISMGRILSLTVVAEGVETREQMDFLRKRACDEMQGFYFSKPILPDQFARLMEAHKP